MAEKKRGPGRPAGSKNKKSSSGNGSKAKEKAREIQAKKKADRRVIDEIWAIIAIAVGIFLIIATLTHGAGQFGEMIGGCLKGLFGFVAYVLPFYLIIFGILLFARQTVSISVKVTLLVLLLLLMLTIMNSVRFVDAESIDLSLKTIKGFYSSGTELKSGGFFGMLLASLLVKWLGKAGCWIVALVVTLICLLLIINTPVSRFVGRIGDRLEERKLIRENAHLDEEIQPEPEEKQMSIKDVPEKKEEAARKAEAADAESERRAFGRKRKLISYMKDENILGGEESSGTYGLEEKRDVKQGYGLEEKIDYGKGYGLDGSEYGINSRPGFGLDGGSAAEETAHGSESISTYADIYPEPDAASDAHAFDGAEAPAEAAAPDGAASAAETPAHAEKKLSNSQARDAMLSKEEMNDAKTAKEYKLPPVSLLEKSKAAARTNERALNEKAEKLEETLKNFHVDARVVKVTQGPTVTRYEIQPSVGVKVNSIVRLADDIALNLEARSIRIEAPIPGKPAVGIEVENDSVTTVHIRDIVDSDAFRNSKSKISFVVGKDIGGKAIVADLKAMPHLLIAGSTGSGKSVCINGIITSLLYKARPDEVKLILVDPKVVELGNYNGIPHLMIPVVTDPAKAAAALNWAVAEMTDRYKKFAEEGVRDLTSYNEYVRANEEFDKVMPQVVIIIDELADLMMAAPSQIEESICRLAQMARAAGMHLIVATQRPSVDVITGVIKANIPSRIAFAVSSQVDSRTILDMQGAEKLVGKGDMLFNPMGMGKPIRVQGAFISDAEVHKVIEFVKSQVTDADYDQDVLSRIEKNDTGSAEEEADELLPDAIELVVRSGQASVSMLQRRFRIGYNRAARIVDMMEARGIVSPQDGSRPRQVLMTEEEYEAMSRETEDI